MTEWRVPGPATCQGCGEPNPVRPAGQVRGTWTGQPLPRRRSPPMANDTSSGTRAKGNNAKGKEFMATTLDGKKIAFLVAPEGVEQVELTEPWKAIEQAGGTPELVSTEVGKIQAFNHLTPADTFEADKSADSVSASDYAG